MHCFDYCRKTKIYFGAGRAAEVGKIAAGFGRKALYVTYDEKTAELLRLDE